MPTMLDSRQIKKRIALLKLGAAAGSTLESILDKINTEVDFPLRMAASATPDALLNFSSSLVATADGANEVVAPVKKQIFASLANPTINFQTQALSNAADFDITWGTATLSQFRFAAFTLIGSGKIKVLFSSEFGSEAALIAAVNPGSLYVSGGLPIGYITLQATQASPAAYKTAGSATSIIENAKIYRFGSGAGGGSATASSSGGGGELVDLLYKAAIRDSFSDIPDGTTTVNISAGFTDPTLHDVANELFRLSYDASKTVTGTGTSMTLSGAPTFTIKAGDMLVVGSEARKITAVGTQTTPTIESAFTVDPSGATCCVSQAVHTVDLNTFTNGGLGLSAASQFTGTIEEALVGYADSSTLADIIPDFGTAAVVAYSASSDGTSWSDAKIRPVSLSNDDTFVAMPTTSTQMLLRFFANKTSGSGAVNLLAYKTFFHKESGEFSGSGYSTAFARPTAGIFQNVSHAVVSGKSRFTFTFPYGMGLNLNESSGSVLDVIVNGQIVPRYNAALVDPGQAYFTEISSTVIEMDSDYSASGFDFQFKVRSTVIDTNTQNQTSIALVAARTTVLESLVNKVAYLKDIKPSGTQGGSASAATTAQRVLNTLEGDTSIVTLSANQFKPIAGTYKICAKAPAFRVNNHRCRIRNITDSTTIILGSSEYAVDTQLITTSSEAMGTLTTDGTKWFELQHYTNSAFATQGLGAATASGESEVFSVVELTKIG